MIDYHNKQFKVVSNSDNGDISEEMIFLYQQIGEIISCEYEGPNISDGHLIGVVDEDGSINFRYRQLNAHGEEVSGICYSKPEIMDNGKIRLHESWRWTSGDQSTGESILEEL
ncbi:MAG: n-acetylglutamate synthase [Crocinitomicaceae bacterium]|nr:n-acetylglutamate synthase [Crocinitomicaceae bacterium]